MRRIKNYVGLLVLSLFIFLCLTTQFVVNAEAGLLPKMPLAPDAKVYDIQKDNAESKIAAMSIQGLVNRNSASIYLLHYNQHLQQLVESKKSYTVTPLLQGANPGIRTLFRDNKNIIKKLIVYDLNKDWTINVALMKGAQEIGIPVTDGLRDVFVSEFGWNGPVEDIRNNWAGRVPAYDWALANLMPNCSKDIAFSINYNHGILDYAVSTKGFSFWLDQRSINPNSTQEEALTERIFKQGNYKFGATVTGYALAGDDLNKYSNPYGLGYIAGDFYCNASYWSSFPTKTYNQAEGKPVKPLPGKIYVSLFWSDGDNLQFDQNATYSLWHDPARGSIPVGTSLAPALQEINTPLLDWYYAQKSANDEIMSGPSGYQFIYGDYYSKQAWPTWLDFNARLLKGMGAKTTSIWLMSYPSGKFTDYINNSGLDGIFSNANYINPQVVNNTAVLHEYVKECFKEGDVYSSLAALTPDPNAPMFKAQKCIVQFYGFDNDGKPVGFTRMKSEIDRLNAEFPGRFVFLMPKDLSATMKSYLSQPSTVVIKSNATGKYVTTDSTGMQPLNSSSTLSDLGQTYEIIKLSNDQVAFKSHVNNTYISVNLTNQQLFTNKLTIGDSEKFTLIDAGNGQVAIKANANGKYVSSSNLGNEPITAISTSVGNQEKYNITSKYAYKMKNKWTGEYLNVQNATGKVECNLNDKNDTAKWIFQYVGNGFVRIKNYSNNKYMNIESNQSFIQCDSNDWGDSAKWIIEGNDSEGYLKIKNYWKSTYMNIEKKLGYVEMGDFGGNGWDSAKWSFMSDGTLSEVIQPNKGKIGDVNGDNKIDSLDLAVLKRYLVGIVTDLPVEDDWYCGDLNGDNMINSTDYAFLKRFILGMITEFPKKTNVPTQTPVPLGNVTYTIIKADKPTSDQLDAYQKISNAMDTAVRYYNQYTTISAKITVLYEPNVPTADGNINGTIRFGSNRSYMVPATAMHEIAHISGVGTSWKWGTLIVNGVYTGNFGSNEIKKITGKSDAVINGDSMHFWPYGLNYASEAKSELDLINHCKIVNEMKKDGI